MTIAVLLKCPYKHGIFIATRIKRALTPNAQQAEHCQYSIVRLKSKLQDFYISNVQLRKYSNSLRFTSFFFPTYNTKLQPGTFNNSSIRLIPILEYSDASLIVKLAFSQIGTLSMLLLLIFFNYPFCCFLRYPTIFPATTRNLPFFP